VNALYRARRVSWTHKNNGFEPQKERTNPTYSWVFKCESKSHIE